MSGSPHRSIIADGPGGNRRQQGAPITGGNPETGRRTITDDVSGCDGDPSIAVDAAGRLVTTRIDLKRELKHVYSARAGAPSIVDVPELGFLSIDGSGDPNTSTAYTEAIEALYAVAYALRFTLKGPGGLDFTVMPLEGLWWADDMSAFRSGERSRWQWTALIAQPEPVTAALVEEAAAVAVGKRPLPARPKLRFERFHEGLAAQVLHVGPYSAEAQTIELLHEFIAEHGFRLAGKHHEIYLSDPRRSAPENRRTIVRQPIL